MIKDGMIVSLAYCLKDSNGEVLDESDLNDPFVYLHGAGQVVPGLEGALEGMKAGEKKAVVVEPLDGYGEIDPELKLIVNKSQFPSDADLVEGMQFGTKTTDGDELIVTVESIEEDKVHVDANHPLAGKQLFFDVEVIAVRDATEEERSHGHAHDEHGHGHGHDGHGHDGHGHDH